MMRLARRATLLVAFSLLTSAATAYAECAWVLWLRDYSFDNKIQTGLITAFKTKDSVTSLLAAMKRRAKSRSRTG